MLDLYVQLIKYEPTIFKLIIPTFFLNYFKLGF